MIQARFDVTCPCGRVAWYDETRAFWRCPKCYQGIPKCSCAAIEES